MQINFNSVSRDMQNNTTVSTNVKTSNSKELLFKPSEAKLSDNISNNPPQNFEELKEFLANTFALEADNITAKTQFVKELKFEYLDFVNLTLKLEGMYRCRFDDDKITKLKTVGDLMNLIQEKIKNDTINP